MKISKEILQLPILTKNLMREVSASPRMRRALRRRAPRSSIELIASVSHARNFLVYARVGAYRCSRRCFPSKGSLRNGYRREGIPLRALLPLRTSRSASAPCALSLRPRVYHSDSDPYQHGVSQTFDMSEKRSHPALQLLMTLRFLSHRVRRP